MATEVASLYASIGADTSGLHKGFQELDAQMAAAEQKMLGAEGAIKKLEMSADGAGDGLSSFAGKFSETDAAANKLSLVLIRLADAQNRLANETDPMKQAELKVQIDDLTRSAGKLKTEMDKLDDGGKRVSTSMGDVGMALGKMSLMAGGAYLALKQVYDLGKQGAAIEQTAASFDRLGISIDALRAASLGTVDDMTLMKATLTLTAGASETLQGKLLTAAPQLMEIAKAANALNPTLGDTAFMYESIATGVKRASPLILDNLGIVVKIGEANQKYADQLGKTVEALTEEEKQVALLNATLDAGARLIEQNGGSLESAADSYAKLAVEITNAKGELAKFANVLTGPVVVALGRGASATMGTIKELGALRVLVPLLAGDYGSFMTALTKADSELRAHEKQLRRQEELAKLNATATTRYADTHKYLIEQLGLTGEGMKGLTQAGEEYLEWQERYQGDAQHNLNLIQQQIDTTARATAAFDAEASQLSELSTDAFAGYVIAQAAATMGAEDFAVAQRAILEEFGLLTPAELAASAAISRMNGHFLSGKATAADYAAELRNIKAGLDGLYDKEIEVRVKYNEGELKGPPTGGVQLPGTNPTPPAAPYVPPTVPRTGVPGFAEGGFLPVGGYGIVGEGGGPEMIYPTAAGVQVVPMGGGDGGTRVGTTWTGDININGVADPEAAANAVIRKLADRGIIRSGGFR